MGPKDLIKRLEEKTKFRVFDKPRGSILGEEEGAAVAEVL
jgi:hypothetical protein